MIISGKKKKKKRSKKLSSVLKRTAIIMFSQEVNIKEKSEIRNRQPGDNKCDNKKDDYKYRRFTITFSTTVLKQPFSRKSFVSVSFIFPN